MVGLNEQVWMALNFLNSDWMEGTRLKTTSTPTKAQLQVFDQTVDFTDMGRNSSLLLFVGI